MEKFVGKKYNFRWVFIYSDFSDGGGSGRIWSGTSFMEVPSCITEVHRYK